MIRAFAVFCLFSFYGCAASHLKAHATAAYVTGTLIDDAGAIIEREARDDELAVLEHAQTRAEAQERIEGIRTTYRRIESTYAALRQAHAAYVRAIVEANAHDTPISYTIARGLLDAWSTLVALAEPAGLSLPVPPPELVALTKE